MAFFSSYFVPLFLRTLLWLSISKIKNKFGHVSADQLAYKMAYEIEDWVLR